MQRSNQQGKQGHRQDQGQHPRRIMLKINGVQTAVHLSGGVEHASGKGLDGVTEVKSLRLAYSNEYPGKVFIQDSNENWIMTDAHEVYVADKHIAKPKGFEVASTRI